MNARKEWTKAANGRRAWLPEEDAVLRGNWQTRTHAELAVAMGRNEKSVRNRCWQLRLVDTTDDWTTEQIATLRAAYAAPSNKALDLAGLAKSLARTTDAVCQKAASLRLTNHRRAGVEVRKDRRQFKSAEALRQHQSERQKRVIAERGHPRGMLGKKHSAATKERISQTSAAMNAAWTLEQYAARALKAMKTRAANGTEITPRLNASWKAGWRVIGGARKFYRSRWEANYARYLEWLRKLGEIIAWKHEPKTFWFEGVKRGTVSYLPDFWVREKSGAESYHEVKGWMDERSQTKLKRMAKYHPAVKIIVIREKQYNAIARKVSMLIPEWELARRSA